MEQENDKTIRDYDVVLDAKYGAPGTPERERFEEEAFAFYSGRMLRDARKDARMTQSEVAVKIGANKSYISRVEKGDIIPSVGVFYKIVHALGMEVRITKVAPSR